MADSAPLVGIVGWKNSGKTTLTERLISELTRRGYTVATLKHSHHELRTHDGATDGERHARAGAVQTAVIAPTQWELGGELQSSAPPALEDVAHRLGPADIILVEGFKSAPIPKIEVRRLASPTREPLEPGDPHIIAIAADHTIAGAGVPVLALDDVKAIADLILEAAGIGSR